MPIKNYYKGRGNRVMRRMKKQYGDKKGKRIFYATANAWRTRGTKAQKRAQPKRAPGSRRR